MWRNYDYRAYCSLIRRCLCNYFLVGMIIIHSLLVLPQIHSFHILDYRIPHTKTTKDLMWISQYHSSIRHYYPALYSSNTDSGSGESVASSSATVPKKHTVYRARDLMKSLIEEDLCYTTETGASAFSDVCAVNCIYEDRYEPQPIVGKIAIRQHMLQKVQQRYGGRTLDVTNNNKNKVGYRIDKISDGNNACGYTWTWTCDDKEGLRGTTYVELNDSGEIQFIAEIPEPIFKPGDATKDLLKAITADAVRKEYQPYIKKVPVVANEIAKYMYIDLQATNRSESIHDLLKLFDENVIYRDFNYEKPFLGHDGVKQLVFDFDFPGITFNPLRFDDGIDATCFTWEVLLSDDAPDTIKGISFLELDPVTRKIIYARDVPESAIKPPILGKLARMFKPGLGVFNSVPLNSRPGGM